MSSLAAAEPLVEGHSAQMLTNGRDSFVAKNRAIRDADVVMLKTYAFIDDESGRDMVRSLVTAAQAGKKVVVEFDVKGTGHNPFQLFGNAIGIGSSIPAHLRPLVEAGVTVIPTNRLKDRLDVSRPRSRQAARHVGGRPARARHHGRHEHR
ncbi:MAG: hypothetical protein ABI321_00120 [Polyangia bacterium]